MQGCKIYRPCVVAVLVEIEDVLPEIKKGLEEKLEAMVRRDLYTKYKTAPTEEEREKATVAKTELEQTPVKRVKSFVKAKSEPVAEMPKKSALASKYPRLADIYNKLENCFMAKRSLKAMMENISWDQKMII